MVPMDRHAARRRARVAHSWWPPRKRHPARYLLSAPAKRHKRIYIDYLRNGRGTTAIGTYSPRAREGFPLAAPVTWKRVESGIAPDAFTIGSPFRAEVEEVSHMSDAFDRWVEWRHKPSRDRRSIPAELYAAVMSLPEDDRSDRQRVNEAVRQP